MARMTGVTLYEPAELVVSAKSGTPLEEVETILAGSRQRLAFEPMDHQNAVDGNIGQGYFRLVAQRHRTGPVGRPVQHALLRRHGGDDTLRLVAER